MSRHRPLPILLVLKFKEILFSDMDEFVLGDADAALGGGEDSFKSDKLAEVAEALEAEPLNQD